ncbi:MAG: helix-turn-helix domain-containing protein [Altererythrobacter sp.]|nr:helix-turn-helix domain-containing protein [Altererythrobacter sp.]OJU58883.1 MAG: transcriptional regulator [Altererythrobacter sp. 66-12]
MILLPEQCRAARALLNWTQAELARYAGVSRSTVRDFEGARHQLHRSTEAQLIRTLEIAGVRLLPADREGPGARLCK